MTDDVNIDQPDLSSKVRVQILIGRYFSRIHFAIVAEEIQITQNDFTLYVHFQYVLLKNREVFLSKLFFFQIRSKL